MENKKNRFDIVNEVLEACILAYPVSSFIISLYKQYISRGSLSKKQLQGLHGKASDIDGFSPAKLATLEALIKKMPNRYKSELPEIKEDEDNAAEERKLIEEILKVFPAHKRVLLLKGNINKNIPLTSTDRQDLKRFMELAAKYSAANPPR